MTDTILNQLNSYEATHPDRDGEALYLNLIRDIADAAATETAGYGDYSQRFVGTDGALYTYDTNAKQWQRWVK
jgi:hypothetical protein